MTASAAESTLEQIRVDQIERNENNPRIVLRPGELEELLESIRIYKIQVPISVYRDGTRYILIDGERRWRCALKLNLRTIPALVQQKPTPLDNLLLMFNIHALREQWDLLTIALKLPTVVKLLTEKLGRRPTEAEIAERAGVNKWKIQRCKLLMELPPQYHRRILKELEKPKSQQKLTEDLFIEMERALKTVERAMPEVLGDKDAARRTLLSKFEKGTINNRIHFRLIPKIVRAKKIGVDPQIAIAELKKLFAKNTYSIAAAYANSVGDAYKERDIGTKIESLLSVLEQVSRDELDEDVKGKLKRLVDRATGILREKS